MALSPITNPEMPQGLDQRDRKDLREILNQIIASIPEEASSTGETAGQSRWQFSDIHTSTASSIPPFTASSAISSGTNNSSVLSRVDSKHPGLNLIRSSTSANSGWIFNTQSTYPLVIGEGYTLRSVFKTPEDITATSYRVGFTNSTNALSPSYGVFLGVAVGGAATLTAKTSGTTTTAATSYTMLVNTWYTIDITLTSDTVARCIIRTDDGAVVYDETVSSNVPSLNLTAALVPQWVGFSTGTTAIDVALVDYLGFGPERPSFISLPA